MRKFLNGTVLYVLVYYSFATIISLFLKSFIPNAIAHTVSWLVLLVWYVLTEKTVRAKAEESVKRELLPMAVLYIAMVCVAMAFSVYVSAVTLIAISWEFAKVGVLIFDKLKAKKRERKNEIEKS